MLLKLSFRNGCRRNGYVVFLPGGTNKIPSGFPRQVLHFGFLSLDQFITTKGVQIFFFLQKTLFAQKVLQIARHGLQVSFGLSLSDNIQLLYGSGKSDIDQIKVIQLLLLCVALNDLFSLCSRVSQFFFVRKVKPGEIIPVREICQIIPDLIRITGFTDLQVIRNNNDLKFQTFGFVYGQDLYCIAVFNGRDTPFFTFFIPVNQKIGKAL